MNSKAMNLARPSSYCFSMSVSFPDKDGCSLLAVSADSAPIFGPPSSAPPWVLTQKARVTRRISHNGRIAFMCRFLCWHRLAPAMFTDRLWRRRNSDTGSGWKRMNISGQAQLSMIEKNTLPGDTRRFRLLITGKRRRKRASA